MRVRRFSKRDLDEQERRMRGWMGGGRETDAGVLFFLQAFLVGANKHPLPPPPATTKTVVLWPVGGQQTADTLLNF